MATARPIFIHSLFRSASTFVAQKFRALEIVSCYQEPFNESLAELNDTARHDRLRESPAPQDGRPRQLDQPDFYEFCEARRHPRRLPRTSVAYEDYFAPEDQLPAAQRAWLSAVIEQAPARPVLRLYGSAGRIAALRRLYGGTHVHLWREPRAQWWSYKVADHFDTQRIYRSASPPEALRLLRRMARVPRWRLRPALPRDDYLLFYGLWLDAWLRLCADSDLSINLDRILRDPTQNAECTRQLAALVGTTIDLSDIRASDLPASGLLFASEEEPFYAEVEGTVREVFAHTGHATPQALQLATAAAASARSVYEGRTHDSAAEQNLRLAAMSLMRSLAGNGRPGGGRWPYRWYPRRLHDYVYWALKRVQQRQKPPIERGIAPTSGTATGPAAVDSPPGQPSWPIR